MAKKADLQQWMDRLTISHRKNKDMKDKIKMWRDYYRGNQWWGDSVKRHRDHTVDNVVFSNIKTIMPSINLNNPRIFSKPIKKPYQTKNGLFDTVKASVGFEILMNYYYRELETKREVDKCLMDALIGPWGIMQLGYTLETEKIKNEELIEINELIKSESIFAVRRSPLDFRFDTEAMDSHMDDARWIAFRWVKSLEDVKANSKYTNTKFLKSNMRAKTEFRSADNIPSGEELREDPTLWNRVEGWDIWDRKTRILMSVVEGHNSFLLSDKWATSLNGIDGFPVEILYFNENPDDVFPISDVDIYIDAQDELNILGSLQLSHIRRISERKYVTQEQTLDAEAEIALERGGDGTIVHSKKAAKDAVVPIQDASISQDIYLVRNIQKNNIREASGIAGFEKGASEKFRQATEPALISQSIGVRRQERLNILERFITRIIKKESQILQETLETTSIPLSEEQFQTAREFELSTLDKIVGENASTLNPWLNLSKKDIKGEYEFEIDIGSTSPINTEQRKQDAVMLAQLLQNNPWIKGREGTKLLIEAFEQDVDKLLKTPKEMQQEQQAAAQAAIQAEVAKDKPKRDTDLAKTQMKEAGKVRSDDVKSRTTARTDNVKSQTAILTTMLKDKKKK